MVARFLTIVLGLVITAWLTGCGGKPTNSQPASIELPTVANYDFRQPPDVQGRTRPPDELKFSNLLNESHLQFRADGVHYHVPSTFIYKAGSAVGLQTTFGLRGDFDVTASFTDFQGESPSSGTGVGIGLSMGTMDSGVCQIARVVRQNNLHGIRYTWWKQGGPIDELVPCNDTEGRLRMQRIGSTLSYLWAPGTQGENCQTVYQCALGASDIRQMNVSVFTFGTPRDVSARLLSWSFRGQKELDPVSDPSKGPSEERRPRFALMLAALIVALTLTVFGVWGFIRRRWVKLLR
jgi:hypothetical protein